MAKNEGFRKLIYLEIQVCESERICLCNKGFYPH